jgi:hypothetical protein
MKHRADVRYLIKACIAHIVERMENQVNQLLPKMSKNISSGMAFTIL